MAQSLNEMVTLFVTNNKKHLANDGYLSFEDVKSIELDKKNERKLQAHWIDGVQLNESNKLIAWLSTINSSDIKLVEFEKLPKSLRFQVLQKIAETIAYKEIRK